MFLAMFRSFPGGNAPRKLYRFCSLPTYVYYCCALPPVTFTVPVCVLYCNIFQTENRTDRGESRAVVCITAVGLLCAALFCCFPGNINNCNYPRIIAILEFWWLLYGSVDHNHVIYILYIYMYWETCTELVMMGDARINGTENNKKKWEKCSKQGWKKRCEKQWKKSDEETTKTSA